MRACRNQILTVLVIMSGVWVGGCYNDYVIFPDGGDYQGNVSFSADLLPVFDKSCNTSGCHTTGGQKPDLTPANAYNALVNGNYLNAASPEESEIYVWMKGIRSLPMPPSGVDINNTAKVLAWIRQGAPNN